MIVSVPPPKRHKNDTYFACGEKQKQAHPPSLFKVVPVRETASAVMEIVAYSPSFVNGTARLFDVKSVQKSARKTKRAGKLFVKFLPLCIAPAPPWNAKIRKNVQTRRKKVGKMCKTSRKTSEKCAKFSCKSRKNVLY
ncbi:MAG TPA: hypothetical protein DDY70_04645 [Clostridiales bacterium]|nr:hypothetical protein [Clostridiales bacterium]